MKAKIIRLTPSMAKKLLEKNTGNRTVTKMSDIYANDMREGRWKENGEPLIIDKNGVLKDGQHRCLAVISSGISFMVPLISDIAPDVMDTIDTGRNRSFADVLTLMGESNVNNRAAAARQMYLADIDVSDMDANSNRYPTKAITNNVLRQYYFNNKKKVLEITSNSSKLYKKQHEFVFDFRLISRVLYLISGGDILEEHIEFMKSLLGINSLEGTSANWVHKKISYAKRSHTKLRSSWKLAMCIKAWNNFVNGDPQIGNLRYKDSEGMPLPLTI